MIRSVPRPLRFATVGAINTGIDVFVFIALATLAGIPPLAAHIASYTAGSVASFLLNKSITFGDRNLKKPIRRQVFDFIGVNLITLALTSAVLMAALTVLSSVGAKLVALMTGMGFGYVAYKRFVFN